MPVGQSQDHMAKYKAIHTNVDPFGKNGQPPSPAGDSSIVADARDVAPPPPEETVPAPEHLAPAEVSSPHPDERGTVVFTPVNVETPTRGEQPDPRMARLELPADRPAAETPAPAPTDANRKVYVVKAGDTLTKISRQFYGKDGDRLTSKIYEANKTTLKDPHRLLVGQKLVIPGVPAEAPQPPKTDAPPAGDPPKRSVPCDSLGDSAFAAADKAGRPPLRIPSSRTPAGAPPGAADAGADGRKPAALFRDSPGPVRDVTVEDLEKMYGAQSDLVEQPVKPAGTYTVQAGDTFYGIATKLYGDGTKYGRLLYLKNQHLVPDVSKLRIGQRIVLLDGASAAPDTAVAAR
jgi:nucleoid-associated protein YgaU